MNSSLQRVCASRGRMLHRSKNLERHVLVLPSGAEVFLGMRPSTQKVAGRNDGKTFSVGINAMKRGGVSPSIVADMKKLAWWGARG